MHVYTIRELLEEAAGSHGPATAILAPGREPMRFGDLASHVERIAGGLRAEGIGRTDRVAIVLPNGPDLATAFPGVAAAAGCAPLNPAFTREQFEFCLTDLRARARCSWRNPATLLVRVPGRRPDAPALGWSALLRGPLEIADLPCYFEGSMSERNLPALAELLRSRLNNSS